MMQFKVSFCLASMVYKPLYCKSTHNCFVGFSHFNLAFYILEAFFKIQLFVSYLLEMSL